MYKQLVTLLLLVSFFSCISAQEKSSPLLDSKIQKQIAGKSSHQQSEYYDSLSGEYTNSDPTVALQLAKNAMEIALNAGNQLDQANAAVHMGKALKQLGEYDHAISQLNSAITIYQKFDSVKFEASVYNDLGNIYYVKGEFNSALSYYIKASKIADAVKDLRLQGLFVNNIGNIYFFQENYDKAILFYNKAFEYTKANGDSVKAILALDNIGLVYTKKEEFDMALLYHTTALAMVERLNNKKLMAEVLMNLGGVNSGMGKHEVALSYFQRSFDNYKLVDSKYGMAACLLNLGDENRVLKNYSKSIQCLAEAYAIAESIKAKDLMKESALNTSTAYEEMGNSAKALVFYKIYSELKDSVNSEESTNQINELSAKYESDKKQQEIELLTKDKDLQDEKLKNQKVVTLTLIAGIVVVVLLLILMIFWVIGKQKANTILADKNKTIQIQKELVFEKNKEITDSINYARRIQDAMLPSHKILNEFFKENFVYYAPKDIISGDFYWATRKGDQLFIAASDCTGHGVPGALMSMIGVSFLRQIINESNITDTAEVLNKLHEMVLHALNEDVTLRSSKDGMDISLLKVDIGNRKAEFSGAVRPLYMVNKEGLQVIKGDRFSIGGIKSLEESFSKTEISISSSTSFYLFSDGFADQFGGPEEKKFMVKKLQELIAKVYSLPMDKQKAQIQKAFSDWKGEIEQTDDVLILGVKV